MALHFWEDSNSRAVGGFWVAFSLGEQPLGFPGGDDAMYLLDYDFSLLEPLVGYWVGDPIAGSDKGAKGGGAEDRGNSNAFEGGGLQPGSVLLVTGQGLGFVAVGDATQGKVKGMGGLQGMQPVLPGPGANGLIVNKDANFGLWGAIGHGAGPEGAKEVGPKHGKGTSLGHGVGAVKFGAEVSPNLKRERSPW